MAYDEGLATRIREALAERPEITERKMFGGLAFMARDNMVCGVVGDELMVRVGAANHEPALARPGARPMVFTGRPMTGMIFVGAAGTESDGSLKDWIDLAYEYADSLPAKKPKASKPRAARSSKA